jgi:prephenate dehydrogenase
MGNQETARIAIIGLGLIGTSLGLALKAGGLTGARLAGFDTSGGNARQAQKMGAIDQVESTSAAAVQGASLVIVAVPILSVREVFTTIAPHLADGATVTDTASTKADVMRWAEDTLPRSVNFVGGHPMAGKETAGPEGASADLLTGRPYCICPSLTASPEAIRTVSGVASLAGAIPLFIDPAEHDQYAAAVSHMPMMLSAALFSLMRNSASWDDLGAVAGPAFRDMTRLASGDPTMAMGIWQTNREALIHWLERIGGELGRYREMLKDAQDEKLLQAFTEVQLQREQFLAEPPVRRPEDLGADVDRGKVLMDMLIGARLADNLRRAMPPEPGDKRAAADDGPRISMVDRVAEGVKRDLEKLEAEAEAKAAQQEPHSPE